MIFIMFIMSNKTIQLVPAVLAATETELKTQLEKVVGLSQRLQVDYVDNVFAKGETVDWQILLDLPQLYHDSLFELHILAKESLTIAHAAADAGFSTLIIPVETLDDNSFDLLEHLKESAELMLSINIKTDVRLLENYFNIIDGVTVMTVIPGRQGNPFMDEGLDKVQSIRQLNFSGIIEIDGDVNLKTIEHIIDYDVNRLVAGSVLTQAENPKKVYNELEEKIKIK